MAYNEQAPIRLSYRKATPDDIDDIMSMVDEIRETFSNIGINQWQSGWPKAELFLADMERDDGVTLVYDEDGDFVSFVVCNEHDEGDPNDIVPWLAPNGKHLVIHRLGVTTKKQGRGIGTTILDKLEQEARDRNCDSIRLDVFYTNWIAQKIYARRGYKFLAHRICGTHVGEYYSLEKLLDEQAAEKSRDAIEPPTKEDCLAIIEAERAKDR